MRIFIITETLLAGGAEWFALRLCEALQQRQQQVSLFVTRPDLVDTRLTAHFKSLNLFHPAITKIKLAVFLDKVLNKISGKTFFLHHINKRFLERKIEELRPEALHSHLLNTDVVVASANKKFRITHTVTVHGDYIQYIKTANKTQQKNIQTLIDDIDHIAVISDEQLRILKSGYPQIGNKICKIYNGYPLPQRQRSFKTNNTFSFGIIARGIPEKGWKPAIEAFKLINTPDVRLYLFGESEYLNALKKENRDNRIIFAGFSNDPLQAIDHLNVGMLPSYYEAESLPTTVIEYLALNKPVIATAVGEIKQMITIQDGRTAGVLIEETDPEEMIPLLHNAMNKLIHDTGFYEQAVSTCAIAFEKFSMEKCIANYLALYQNKMEEVCAAL